MKAKTVDKIVGVGFMLFSLTVFIYFSAWTFIEPFTAPNSALKAIFPPRFWLYILPTAGVVVLSCLILAFVSVMTRDKRTK